MENWQDVWQAALESCIEAERELSDALTRVDGLFEHGVAAYKVLKTWNEKPGAVVAADMIERLERKAVEELSPAGGELAVNFDQVAGNLGIEIQDERGFRRGGGATAIADALCSGQARIGEVWQALSATCSAEDVQQQALETTARMLVRAFQRTLGSEKVREVKGRAVLELGIWTEKGFASEGEGRTLTIGCRDRLGEVARGIDAVMAWAGRATRIASGLCDELGYTTRFRSRTRLEFGEITVVAYYEKLEFHVAKDAAFELNRFLATFAARELEEARAEYGKRVRV